jgi:hypothetical protein
MYSDGDTPKGWVAPFGYPRINACSRLPVAFRSVPRPSSPPGAKASTECPSHAREPRSPLAGASLHAQEPSPQPQLQNYAPMPNSRHQTIVRTHSHKERPAHSLRSAQNIHAPEPTPVAGQPDIADRSATSNQPVRHCNQARPETYQNLIYPDKDHNDRHATGMPSALPDPLTPPSAASQRTRNPNASP